MPDAENAYKKKMKPNDPHDRKEVVTRLLVALAAVVVILLFDAADEGPFSLQTAGMLFSALILPPLLHGFPMGAYICAYLFLIASAAGSILGWYERFYYYDKLLHALSGVLLAWIGDIIARGYLERLYIPDKKPRLVFALVFALAAAAVWELIEFFSDQIFGASAQHGLVDTMTDILSGGLGGTVFVAVMIIRLVILKDRTHNNKDGA